MNNNGSKFMLFLMVFSVLGAFVVLPQIFSLMGYSMYELLYMSASPLFLIMNQLLFLLLPLVVWVFMKREAFSDFIQTTPIEFTNVVIIVLFSFLIQPAMMFVSGLTGLFFPNVISDVMGGIVEYPFWLLILAVAVTPAVVEEVLFRGYIQSYYTKFGIKKAAVISGLFFAIVHMNMHQFFYAFIMGIFFSYIVYYTKSIVAGIISHFVVNASQITLLRMAVLLESLQEELGIEMYEAAAMEITEAQAVIVVGVVALFTTPVALYLLKSLFKRCRAAFYLPKETIYLVTEPGDAAPPEAENETGFAHTTQANPTRAIDLCFVLVVLFYAAFIALTLPRGV